MILPQDNDVGRRVAYAYRDEHTRTEYGAVQSFNPRYVFVRFDGDQQAKACQRRDLEWEDRLPDLGNEVRA